MKVIKRRKRKRLKIFFITVGLISILVMLLFTPIFNIASIEVMGSTRYSHEEIKEKSGLQPGDNAFRQLKMLPESILELRLTDSEKEIEKLPYVKSCKVSIILPTSVSISIFERQPAAYIRYLDNYLTVDSQGYVLETNHQRPEGELMEIRGIEFTKYTLGGQLEVSDSELITGGVKIINAIKESDRDTQLKLFEILDWIDMVDKNNVLLSLDNRIIVRFNPEDKLQYAMDFTKEVFFKKINSKETGRLEFVGNQNPSFIPD